MKKLSQEEVVNRLINKRGTENFDYSKVVYISRRTPYAINNKINLIIIPYWDYEKIDTILEENLWVEKK